MNILITGIHGFVGPNIVMTLKEHHTLYGLDIIAPSKEGVMKTFSWKDMEADISDKEELPIFDAIIHLAGKAHDTKNRSAAQVYFDINTRLTEKIFDFFLRSSAKKFIFFSSVKAAADIVVGDVLTEEVVPKPIGPYGESKIKAEEYILSNLEIENGQWEAKGGFNKQVYILRPCMIHGPGNKGNLNLLYSVISKGIPWPLGKFDNRRTFTSVENVCFAVNELLTKSISSGIYNMGDDEALSTNELIEVICSTLGRKARIWRLSKSLIVGCAKVGGWLHFSLNPERLRKLTENYVSSNQKIKDALGIKSFPVTAREGLIKTIQSFIAQ